MKGTIMRPAHHGTFVAALAAAAISLGGCAATPVRVHHGEPDDDSRPAVVVRYRSGRAGDVHVPGRAPVFQVPG